MELKEREVEQIARQIIDDFAAHSGDLTALLVHRASPDPRAEGTR